MGVSCRPRQITSFDIRCEGFTLRLAHATFSGNIKIACTSFKLLCDDYGVSGMYEFQMLIHIHLHLMLVSILRDLEAQPIMINTVMRNFSRYR